MEFEKQRALIGHMAVHSLKKQLKVEQQQLQVKTLMELCEMCRFYKNGVCVTPKQIPYNWDEKLNSNKCSLFEIRGREGI